MLRSIFPTTTLFLLIAIISSCQEHPWKILEDNSEKMSLANTQSTFEGCGAPIIEAFDGGDTLRGSINDPKSAISQISRKNLETLISEVGQLNDVEKRLFQAAELMMPPDNTHRTNFDQLKALLSIGAIESPKVRQRRDPTATAKVTPPQEEALYGAFGCVFTAVGPIDGRAQYGNVILRFKPLRDNVSFATYSSGFTFMKGRRTATCEKQCQCSIATTTDNLDQCTELKTKVGAGQIEAFDFASLETSPNRYPCYDFCSKNVLDSMERFKPGVDERSNYARTLVGPDDYAQWFQYSLIKLLRKNKNKDQLTQSLLEIISINDPKVRRKQWWNLVDTSWLGYLEAKYDGRVEIKDLESIEVPSDKLEEVRRWNLDPGITRMVKEIPQ